MFKFLPYVRKNILDKVRAKDTSFLDAILGEGDELGVYTVPGDGMVDYAAVFEQLHGYSGWVVVEAEQDPAKAPPLEYSRMGHRHLTAAFEAAGYRIEQ